jgi:hypothetical protein
MRASGLTAAKMIARGKGFLRRILTRPRRLIRGPQGLLRARARSVVGKWNYGRMNQFAYGDETTYRKGMAFLDGHGDIEDWGCGTAFAKRFVTRSTYLGIDGSRSDFTDKVADLRTYRSNADCIFIRHVLEHNYEWRAILTNAVGSFQRRFVLVIFTPFADSTHPIATWSGIPDITFRKDDLTEFFRHLPFSEESVQTNTQYRTEHIFYVERPSPGS